MTESSTTILRRMLDERGVEYRVSATGYSIDIGPNMTAYANRTDTTLDVSLRGTTPAQAIAATLGATDARPTQAESSETCRDKGNIERFICSECGCRLDLQDDDWEATMWVDGAAMVPNYCPNCGRQVVSE